MFSKIANNKEGKLPFTDHSTVEEVVMESQLLSFLGLCLSTVAFRALNL